MRELTKEEFELVAGGSFMASQPDGPNPPSQPWWHDAFQALSDGLNAIGTFSGTLIGQLLSGYGNVAENMIGTGDLINARNEYTAYCIDQQSNGQECQPFDDWYNGG